MKIIGIKKLTDFAQTHNEVRSQIATWISEVKDANWQDTYDVKDRYASADFFKNNHVVINIKGNKYRLLFQVDYQRGIVFIKDIDSHAEYDKWNLS